MTRRDFLKALGIGAAAVACPALSMRVNESDAAWTIVTVSDRYSWYGGRTYVLTEGYGLDVVALSRYASEGMRRGMIRGYAVHCLPLDQRAHLLSCLGIACHEQGRAS